MKPVLELFSAESFSSTFKSDLEEGATIDERVESRPVLTNEKKKSKVEKTFDILAEEIKNTPIPSHEVFNAPIDSVVKTYDETHKLVTGRTPYRPRHVSILDIYPQSVLMIEDAQSIYTTGRQFYWGPNPPKGKPQGEEQDFLKAAVIFEYIAETFPTFSRRGLAHYNAGLSHYKYAFSLKQGKERSDHMLEAYTYFMEVQQKFTGVLKHSKKIARQQPLFVKAIRDEMGIPPPDPAVLRKKQAQIE